MLEVGLLQELSLSSGMEASGLQVSAVVHSEKIGLHHGSSSQEPRNLFLGQKVPARVVTFRKSSTGLGTITSQGDLQSARKTPPSGVKKIRALEVSREDYSFSFTHTSQEKNDWNVAQALDLVRNDVLYMDFRARSDVLALKSVHDKVAEVLNPTLRDKASSHSLHEQLQSLKEDLNNAHDQVHVSEARVNHTLQRLAQLEATIASGQVGGHPAVDQGTDSKSRTSSPRKGSKQLNVTGPTKSYPETLKNFWYPIAFSKDVDEVTLVPIECFEEAWVIFRGPDGKPGCIKDQCAHRSCPLSLGKVTEGRVACPYHGWEFSTNGNCEKMPSTRHSAVSVKSLPCVEQDGMIWVWPGMDTPSINIPSTKPPKGFTMHAEIVIELPVEHGLLVENLLDLAHAPFTHTSTFAKGWSVPSMVRFKTVAAAALQGNWDPYPIDMEFRPPCMVVSTIGIVKPGKLDGKYVEECSKHLFQLHACIPSSPGKTRLLYRMALDFASWAKYIPFIDQLWVSLANQVLAEDLRLVLGQQDRMARGANVWNHPVMYDKLGVRYRRWRESVEAGELPFFR